MPDGVIEHRWKQNANVISFAEPLRVLKESNVLVKPPTTLIVQGANDLPVEWSPDKIFGDPVDTLRAILAAYDRYVASYQTSDTEM